MIFTRRQFLLLGGAATAGWMLQPAQGIWPAILSPPERTTMRAAIVRTLREVFASIAQTSRADYWMRNAFFAIAAVRSSPDLLDLLEKIHETATDPDLADNAAMTLIDARPGHPASVRLMRDLLRSPIVYTPYLALSHATRIGPAALPLVREIADRDDDIALGAIQTLHDLGDDASTERIRAFLQGPHGDFAAATIADIGATDLIPDLRARFEKTLKEYLSTRERDEIRHLRNTPFEPAAKALLVMEDPWTIQRMIRLIEADVFSGSELADLYPFLPDNVLRQTPLEKVHDYLPHAIQGYRIMAIITLMRSRSPLTAAEMIDHVRCNDIYYVWWRDLEANIAKESVRPMLRRWTTSPKVEERLTGALGLLDLGETNAMTLVRNDLPTLDWSETGGYFLAMKARLAAVDDRAITDEIERRLAARSTADVKEDLPIYHNLFVRGEIQCLERLRAILDSDAPLEDRVPIAAALNDFAFANGEREEILPR